MIVRRVPLEVRVDMWNVPGMGEMQIKTSIRGSMLNFQNSYFLSLIVNLGVLFYG